MQKNTIILILLLGLLIAIYVLTSNRAEAPAEPISLPPSEPSEPSPEPEPEPEPEPLPPEQPPAETDIPPSETPGATIDDLIGLPESEAQFLAARLDRLFRVVERDGEAQLVTEDYRPGRINAVSEGGIITSFTVEGSEGEETEDTPAGPHDNIIGMTEVEAQAYAVANEVSFRIGYRDGEFLPVTMDYRPGRITASIEGGVVISYSVE